MDLPRPAFSPRTVAYLEVLARDLRAAGSFTVESADELERRCRWPGGAGQLATRLLEARILRSSGSSFRLAACGQPRELQAPAPRRAAAACGPPVPGVRISFDLAHESQLVRQWEGDRIDPWLRAVVLVAAMLYREQGAPRCRVVALLGSRDADRLTPRAHGHVADLSVLELVDGRVRSRSAYVTAHETPKARWIVQRLNLLFPHPDGVKQTAAYRAPEGVIRIETPFGGFPPVSCALGSWAEWGATGRELTPRKVKV